MVEKEISYTLTLSEIKCIVSHVAIQVMLAAIAKNEELGSPENIVKNIIESLDKKASIA